MNIVFAAKAFLALIGASVTTYLVSFMASTAKEDNAIIFGVTDTHHMDLSDGIVWTKKQQNFQCQLNNKIFNCQLSKPTLNKNNTPQNQSVLSDNIFKQYKEELKITGHIYKITASASDVFGWKPRQKIAIISKQDPRIKFTYIKPLFSMNKLVMHGQTKYFVAKAAWDLDDLSPYSKCHWNTTMKPRIKCKIYDLPFLNNLDPIADISHIPFLIQSSTIVTKISKNQHYLVELADYAEPQEFMKLQKQNFIISQGKPQDNKITQLINVQPYILFQDKLFIF